MILFLLVIFKLFLDSFVFMMLYNWYLFPVIGIPINFILALGIILIKHTIFYDVPPDSKDITGAIGTIYFSPIVMLVLGFIFSFLL